MHRLSAIVLGMLAAACNPAETPEQMQARMTAETAAARTAIEAQTQKYAAAFTAQKPGETSAMFLENGVQMAPNQPSVIGRNAIRAGDSTFMSYGSTTLTLATANVVANGPIAVEAGNYTMDFTPGKKAPPGMKATKETGKYLAHWHLVNGQWLIAENIWNTNQPANAPAAPAKKPAMPARK